LPGAVATLTIETSEVAAPAALREGRERLQLAAHTADRDRTILRGIASIFEAALVCRSEEELGREMLEVAESATSSTMGFIGELDEEGQLRAIAMSSPAWLICGVGPATGPPMGDDRSRVGTLCDRVLATGSPVFGTDSDDIGSLELGPFLGVPLLQGGATIGLVAVTNKAGGYDAEDAGALEALAPAIVEAYAHRRTEEWLRESEAKFRGFYDNAPLMMGLCEMDGEAIVRTDLNPAAVQFFGPTMTGASEPNAFERPPAEGSLKLWQGSFLTSRKSDTPVQFELEHVGPRGSRWLEVTVAYLGPARSGRPLFGFVAEDITARRLRDDARDAFTGILAHELRTPITSILAGSELLSSGRLQLETVSDVAQDVAQEARRLTRLVENLLVVSRVERRIAMERHEPVLLHHVARRVVADARRQWPAHHIESTIRPDLPVAAGDEAYATQVLRNLVSNGARYGCGVVVVSASPLDGGIETRVSDDGPGLDPGDEERVFDLFYRGRPSTKVGPGAGMGLFVCRALIEAMHGRIRAETAPTGGAEFVFWLPAYR
jgi:signal transduction histidine kinase